MLDLVARRQILAARIKQNIESQNRSAALKLLEELQREKGYDKMSENARWHSETRFGE